MIPIAFLIPEIQADVSRHRKTWLIVRRSEMKLAGKISGS